MTTALPASMKTTEYMLQLAKQLVDEKKVTESTAQAYIRSLYYLNNKKPFKTLTFLKKTAEIEKTIGEYAENTKKALLATIVSVLSLYKEKPSYKKLYAYYHEKMMGKVAEMRKTDAESSEKTEKEKENWVDWKEVSEKKTALRNEVMEFANKRTITPEQYTTLLHYVVLSLYADIPPRRNQDYLGMVVSRVGKKNPVDALPKDKNYLLLDGKVPRQFVFNVYKTAKTYGQQHQNVPNTGEAPLMDCLLTYLKHHPLAKVNKPKATEFSFLVSHDGVPLTAGNSITRILNKIFNKKIGSSMLRHIFLSSKYDVKDMETTASAMGHSVAEQRNYLRGGSSDNEIVLEITESA
jgi:hypothetical protein